MAERSKAAAENAPGSSFVDSSCIDCDTCRQLAPATFADTGLHSYVRVQPRTAAEERAALHALLACPTASIGTGERTGGSGVPLCSFSGDKREIAAANADFPLRLEDNVYYCGFNSPKSYGGNSYFVEHPAGNWLIDSPRFVESLARRFEQRGGIRQIFLTHRDDVADAEKWASRFGARRIIHRLELSAQPAAEWVVSGHDPIALEDNFLAIPTPGHTRGHVVLLYANRFLFTGDHLAWDREELSLAASRDYCWYSWREQVNSLRKLAGYSFEWVLPGHGQRVCLAFTEMRHALEKLAASCAIEFAV
jgi:glyoxylase-like metal-dependent hydrolase (beta-lactamase superfamily II)/ferredoxin